MAQDFRLPDIGEGLTEAEIVRWHVAVGDTVEVDQIIVDVETAKAVVELPCPYGGVVLRQGAAEGEVLEVGEVVVVIGEPGEGVEEGDGGADDVAVAPAETPPIVGTLSEEAEDLTRPEAEPPAAPGQVKALPLVRKLARELGVDIATVRGTGPEGKITREDVHAAAEATTSAPEAGGIPAAAMVTRPAGRAVATPQPTEMPAIGRVDEPGPSGGRRPMSRLRRTIAANMTRSWNEIPHVTTFDHVDASRLLAVRTALRDRHGQAIPIDALIVRAVVPALAAFPEFNASLDGDDLVLQERADIGVAVDTPDGLLVAVVRDAASMSLLQVADEVVRLGEGAKQRRLKPDELTGQTFTVSNIGAVDGGFGTPIIPYGTTAILSVGRANPAPVVRDGAVDVAPLMPLSLSYDHRVVDGGVGRRFMRLVLENLAEPALFLA